MVQFITQKKTSDMEKSCIKAVTLNGLNEKQTFLTDLYTVGKKIKNELIEIFSTIFQFRLAKIPRE